MAMFEWIETWDDVENPMVDNDKLELWHLDYRPVTYVT